MDIHRYDKLFKLLIVGDSAVGKTCILLRYTMDSFTENHLNTIGIDFKLKLLKLDGYSIKLQIWDTAGQERFRTITQSYYKGAQGIILTYDVTEPKSFKSITNWIKQIDSHAQPNVCKILVGNKCDKSDRKISQEDGRTLAEENGMTYFETSAKTGNGIEEAFEFLAQSILRKNIGTVVEKKENIKLEGVKGKIEDLKDKCCKS